MFRNQNSGQNHILLVTNKYFECVAKFKHLGTIITNKDCIYEGMKSKLQTRVIFVTIQFTTMSSHLLSKTHKY